MTSPSEPHETLSDERIRALGPADLEALIAHFVASAAQSGREGDPINSPYGRDYAFDAEQAKNVRLECWSKPLTEPSWKRSWGLLGESRIVGHAELHGGGLTAELHRCKLGIAVERAHRQQGHALALMRTCINWARSQPQLAWIDLGVFAENRRAVALYQRLGFETIGTLPDRFRVDGTCIDELLMTLAV